MKNMQFHLRSLATLQFSSFHADAEELVQCSLQHKDTFQELEMGTVRLSGGDWPKCISAFVGKLPRLRHARMIGAFTIESGDGEDLEGTGIMPAQKG